jgi:hypothetical protein
MLEYTPNIIAIPTIIITMPKYIIITFRVSNGEKIAIKPNSKAINPLKANTDQLIE